MGSSCQEGQLEKDVPFESTKSTGIYDQINDWNDDKFTWNNFCTAYTSIPKLSIYTHTKLFWTNI